MSDNEWRCSNCSTLLGTRSGDKVHLRMKRRQYVVVGSVLAVCPACSRLNELRQGCLEEDRDDA